MSRDTMMVKKYESGHAEACNNCGKSDEECMAKIKAYNAACCSTCYSTATHNQDALVEVPDVSSTVLRTIRGEGVHYGSCASNQVDECACCHTQYRGTCDCTAQADFLKALKEVQ